MTRHPKTSHPIRKLREVITYNFEAFPDDGIIPFYGIGLGQAEFAHRVGISPYTLKAIELGQRKLSLNLAIKISVATGVDFRSLFDPKGIPRYFGGVPYTTDSFDSYMKTRIDINENLRSTGLNALIDYITIVIGAMADRQKVILFFWSLIAFVHQFCVENKLERTINRKLKKEHKENNNFRILTHNVIKCCFVPPRPKGSAQGKSPKSSPRP